MHGSDYDNSEEKSDETFFFILDALQGINSNISVINNRLETLLLSEIPENAKYDLNEAYEAVTDSKQLLLRLIIRCLRVLDRKDPAIKQ